ncbi:MAG TPA: ATP-binding protein [Chitinophagaceae bacterium]|nr:ATP-binding protein [Chitinophagaceae bacterium]
MNNAHAVPVSLAEMLNDCSIDRVLAIDKKWQIISWNKTAEYITGITKDALFNRNLLDMFPEIGLDGDLMKAIEDALKGFTCFVPSKPGAFNRHYYENHFIPLKDNDGEVFGVMNIMHDVAHRVKTERQLEKLNTTLTEQNRRLEKASAEMATFINITGNDLKEPVRKVYSSLEMIARNDGLRLSDPSRAALRRMQSSLNRINLLLDDMVTLAAANSFTAEFSDIDLNLVMDEALEIMRDKIEEKQARVQVAKLPVIPGSKQMLQYLFVNLLDNAIKFQPDDNIPVVAITVDYITGNTVPGTITGYEKRYVCIKFTDNGIGFTQTDADKIFGMFEKLNPRKKYGGSGIGLTISQKIAESHGGYIEAKGKENEGATLLCYLALP